MLYSFYGFIIIIIIIIITIIIIIIITTTTILTNSLINNWDSNFKIKLYDVKYWTHWLILEY
ncbi:hypothetical protein ACMBCM_04670 [Spiroplasma sp. K1]